VRNSLLREVQALLSSWIKPTSGCGPLVDLGGSHTNSGGNHSADFNVGAITRSSSNIGDKEGKERTETRKKNYSTQQLLVRVHACTVGCEVEPGYSFYYANSAR